MDFETTRRARAEGAELILAARNLERLEHASRELATLDSAAFECTNFDQLNKFFDGLPTLWADVSGISTGFGRRRMRVSRPTAAANNRRYQRFVDLARISSFRIGA
jgi:NADP-dependent 3-hydroxy acid dehydrogenase YdfG